MKLHNRFLTAWSCLLVAFIVPCLVSAQTIRIIPQPMELKSLPGIFTLSDKTTIAYKGDCKTEALVLKDALYDDFDISLDIKTVYQNSILLVLDEESKKGLGDEGYRLNVDHKNITITAATKTGIYYGVQSLRQLMAQMQKKNNRFEISGVSITDKPRFVWRSFMLDEGRYFKGAAVVKRLLDQMAYLKMNIFHWHLTDDQGWRIEIKKYPLLTSIGSKRDSSEIGKWFSNKYDGKPNGGFYTQKEIKEIVGYAAERHITVVPEIEMPGHSTAAIAAYTWLGSLKRPVPVLSKFGTESDAFDVANPKVIQFLEDILDEVTVLFPSKIIHTGGDEVKSKFWKANDTIMAFMKDKKIGSTEELQVWFGNKISNYLANKGSRMMGWNDILGAKLDTSKHAVEARGKLAKNSIIQFWTGELKYTTQAVRNGYSMVNSEHVFTYLDYNYKTIPLSKAYNFDPIPKDLDKKYEPQILGLGCQMWSEWVPNEQVLYNQVFPRLAAYAEVGWTNLNRKDYNSFEQSMPLLYTHWEKYGISPNRE